MALFWSRLQDTSNFLEYVVSAGVFRRAEITPIADIDRLHRGATRSSCWRAGFAKLSMRWQLTATEWAICEDAELSAHDTAMAFAYAHRWRPPLSERISQRDWLAKRNACGQDRECIRMAYRSWIDGLMSAPRSAQILERVGEVDDHGADLLLANVRSFGRRSAPAGSVTVLGDHGNLFIRPLGGDWYFFRIEAAHFYDPHDGRGPNATDSYAVGVAHLPNGKGVWREAPEEPGTAR